jgi:hypothetical protein
MDTFREFLAAINREPIEVTNGNLDEARGLPGIPRTLRRSFSALSSVSQSYR